MQQPIVTRLCKMRDQWTTHLEGGRSVLVWRLAANERRMLDAFVGWANEGEGDDIFVRLPGPWSEDYGDTQRGRLAEMWSSVGEEISQLGVAPWAPPEGSGVAGFGEAARSLGGHLAPLGNLVLVVEPGPEEAAVDALASLARAGEAEGVRWIWAAFDPGEADALLERHAELAGDAVADLHMADAPLEVARAAGTEDAAGQYRVSFLELVKAASDQDIDRCTRWADEAIGVAVAQGWVHLIITVEATLAGAYVGLNRFEPAMDLWTRARSRCDAVEDEPPWLPALAVQTRFGLAGVLLAAQRHGEAAVVYADGGEVATRYGDALMAFEGARMASWCHAERGARQEAWDAGERALMLAEPLDEQLRQDGTLPWLGASLMEVAAALHKNQRDLAARLDALSGPGWEDRAAPP